MSILTITNGQFAPPFTITEVFRQEDTIECSDSFVQFDIVGSVTDYPMKLRINGSPSGARIQINKLGTGTGIFKDYNTGLQFGSEQQTSDGQPNLLSEVELLLTNTGTTRFILRVESSESFRHPVTHQMVFLNCYGTETSTATNTYASASLGEYNSNNSYILISNSKTMYYGGGGAGNI